MNHEDLKTTFFAASVQARREEFERQLAGDSDLTQPHGAETEPASWPVGQLGLVLCYLLLVVAAGWFVGTL